MNALTQQDRDTLEGMIDRAGLAAVLDALGQVCFEKAQHVQTIWRDGRLAHAWVGAAIKLHKASEFPAIKNAGK